MPAPDNGSDDDDQLRKTVVMGTTRHSGQLLREMAERGERDTDTGGDRCSQSHNATVELSDLALSKSQSSRWQTQLTVTHRCVNSPAVLANASLPYGVPPRTSYQCPFTSCAKAIAFEQ